MYMFKRELPMTFYSSVLVNKNFFLIFNSKFINIVILILNNLVDKNIIRIILKINVLKLLFVMLCSIYRLNRSFNTKL